MPVKLTVQLVSPATELPAWKLVLLKSAVGLKGAVSVELYRDEPVLALVGAGRVGADAKGHREVLGPADPDHHVRARA